MEETKDFLLEIGTEEMPSAPLLKAVAQYKKLLFPDSMRPDLLMVRHVLSQLHAA